MDEVGDLTTWGIPDLIPTFARNGISIQSLSAFNVEEMKELVPLVGPQALFMRSWKIWLKTFTDENAVICQNIQDVDVSSCNISLSDFGTINIIQEQELQAINTQQKLDLPIKPERISHNKSVTDNVELMQLLKDNRNTVFD